MRYRLSLGIVALLAMSLLVSACSVIKEYQQKDDFSTKSNDFILRMQWGKFVGASLHFQEDLREPFLERFENRDDFKVTEFSLSRMTTEFDGELERKIALYELEYYLLTDMKLHKEKFKLVWELAAATKEKSAYWRIVTPFPELEIEKK